MPAKPTSRLAIYHSRLKQAVEDPGTTIPENLAPHLQFHLGEIDDFCDIIEAFATDPTDTERARLEIALGDTAHPDRGSSSKARDAQFELRLRGLFAKAGFTVQMAEPDLILSDGEYRIPVAAKRLQAADRFDDRLRSALGQLQRHSEEGIVALCLDQAIRPREHWLAVPNKELLADRIGRQIDEFIEPRVRQLNRRLTGKRAAGLLVTLTTPSNTGEEHYMGSGTHWKFLEREVPGKERSPVAAVVWNAVQRFE